MRHVTDTVTQFGHHVKLASQLAAVPGGSDCTGCYKSNYGNNN